MKKDNKFVWNKDNLGEALGVEIGFDIHSKFVNTDSRKIAAGDIFVALKGDNFDGNKFAEEALKKGAVACVVDNKKLKNPKFIHVDSCLKALQNIGKWRRKHSTAKFVAITGSVGKTGTKEMLYSVLATKYKTYKTEGNFNNHIGLPLTLANMPNDIEYAVIEVGMNNKGEISELVRICQPNISAITWVSEAHIENLGSEENIARAKAEIFEWVVEDGSAVIPADNDFFDLLKEIAQQNGIKNIYGFGRSVNAIAEGKNALKAHILDKEIKIPKTLAESQVLNNILLVLTVADICEVELGKAVEAIGKIEKLQGRGKRIILKNKAVIIDDSYNASPTSMKMALENLAREKAKRRIAVLGDMKELGVFSRDYHEELAQYIHGLDMIITCGVEMKNLNKVIKNKVTAKHLDAKHFETIEDTKNFIEKELKENDVALIKGSHGSNMYKIVDMIKS
jgi:UDP-N-acetylmuramoyl-tripeptide--D-alanyl-D-alanine ligase